MLSSAARGTRITNQKNAKKNIKGFPEMSYQDLPRMLLIAFVVATLLLPQVGMSNETLRYALLPTSADNTESSDDAEEIVDPESPDLGAVDLTSSDLELVVDGEAQLVGVRFRDIDIPPNTPILDAYIQFSTDETDPSDNVDPFNVRIQGEAADNPSTFSDTAFDLSDRPRTVSSIAWQNIPTWDIEHESGEAQRTPSIRDIVQEVVDRAGWQAGNAMVFLLDGQGVRKAESYEGSYSFFQVPDLAPELVITVPSREAYRVRSGADDAEEDRETGEMDIGSSDLELVVDGSSNQLVGVRLSDVTIPKGAEILEAYLQFGTDETNDDDNVNPFEISIQVENTAHAEAFTSTNGNISDRALTGTSVSWTNPAEWREVHETGPAQRTPSLAALVQEIVDRDDWEEGNAVAFVLQGVGKRVAEAFDGTSRYAPELRVTYIGERESSSISKVRLSWSDDPATTMNVIWDQESGVDPVLYYRLHDPLTSCSTDPADYVAAAEPNRVTPYRGMNNHFVKLTDLAADSAYAFVIADSNGVTDCSWFRTAPNEKQAFTFITGGDTKSSGEPLQVGRWSNQMVAKLRPLFVLFTGDFNSGDGTNDARWQQWMTDWSEGTRSEDGRLYPIIAVHGNHEDGDFEMLYNLFDAGNDDPNQASDYTYNSLDFADGLLHVISLNSQFILNRMPDAHQKQIDWLASTLAANEFDTFKIAGYHKPIAPHTQSKRENPELLEWARLFDRYDLSVAYESDTHNHKITFPLSAPEGSGDDFGFVRDDDNGVMYVGEGSWGATPRLNNDDKAWTLDSAALNQIKWNHVYPATDFSDARLDIHSVVTAEYVDGVLQNYVDGVASVDDTDPFAIPDGITIREIPFYGEKISVPFTAVSGTPPLAPSNLTGTATSVSSITINWVNESDPVNVRNLEIERTVGVDAPFENVATGLDPETASFSQSNLRDGTTYVYRVRAINVFGTSEWSNEARVTTPVDTRLKAEFQNGLDGYDGTEIIAIASASPDQSFAGEVMSFDQSTSDYGGPGVALGLIRFSDMFGAGVPDGAIIDSATLRFWTTSSTNGPVGLHRMLVDWNAESAWNTFGGNGVQADDVEAVAAAEDAPTNISSGEFSVFDVTQAVRAWASGQPNHGLLILNQSTDGWDINTELYSGASAAERRPLLTVFYLLRGDADGDGELALNDVIALRGKFNAPVDECPACDVNQDGAINIADARALLLLIRR